MELQVVVLAHEAVAKTRSRNAKVKALAALLVDRGPDVHRVVVPWMAGELRQGRIGIGYATVHQAKATETADLPSLTVETVDAAFSAIAATSGTGAVGARKQALISLLAQATAAEQQFLCMLLTGELRQGALEGVLAEAVGQAAKVDASSVRRAAMLSGNLVGAALAAFEGGEAALATMGLQLFRPVQPMLAKPAEDADAAMLALTEARLEVKLDGARIQVHRDGDRIEVFTRGLLSVTHAVPEVVRLVRALPVSSIVLDGEVLALQPDGRPHPFQTTMRRFGRKNDVASLLTQLPLTPFFFDVLSIDGQVLVDQPLSERIRALDDTVPEVARVAALRTADRAAAVAFLDKQVALGHEGMLAKALTSTYEAGNRGNSWLKVKPVWTLDLVVLAVEWGSGRRHGKLSNLHLGAREPRTGGFVMLGKTFKGLTDEMLVWQTEALLAREVRREGHVVLVRPELVVEVAFNEVQASPRYPGGVALRFARVKGYRPDKTADQADTVDAVRAIHEGTAARAGGQPPSGR